MKPAAALPLVFWSAALLRLLYDSSLAPNASPLPPRKPLSELPLDLLGPEWEGSDTPLPPEIEERAGVTDYVSRRYVSGRRAVWLYVGYVSGYAPESIHHPGICFRGNGLEALAETRRELVVPGLETPVPVMEYLWKGPLGDRTYTLSTFYYNGKFEPSALKLRADRILGIRYFAVITLSGSVFGSLEETRERYRKWLARLLGPLLADHLPHGEDSSTP